MALQFLTDHHAPLQGITVSAEETQAYVRSVRQAIAKELTLAQARRDEFAPWLACCTLPPDGAAALTKELGLTRDAVELPAGAAAPASANAADVQARTGIAEAFIRQWKKTPPWADATPR